MICPVPEDLPDRSRWSGLKAIGVAISDTQRDGKNVSEIRYYILSKFIAASRFADAVRSHWGIENSLHWQLDVTFQEDQWPYPPRPRRCELQHPPPGGLEPVDSVVGPGADTLSSSSKSA